MTTRRCGTALSIHVNGDGVWPDLADKRIHHASLDSVSALAGGMSSGAASVALRCTLEDGSVVYAETSLRLFLAAARAFAARYGWDEKVPTGNGDPS